MIVILYTVSWSSLCSPGSSDHSCAEASQSCISSLASLYTLDLSIHRCDACPEAWPFPRALRLNSFKLILLFFLYTPLNPYSISMFSHEWNHHMLNIQMRNLDIFTEASLDISLPIWLSSKASGCFLYNSFQICSVSSIHHHPPSLHLGHHFFFSGLLQQTPILPPCL